MMPPTPCTQPPCQDLYIYYLKGRVAPDPAMETSAFIGNWEEEQDSFLFFSQDAEPLVQSLLVRQPQLEFIDHFEMTYDQWHGEALVPYCVGDLHVAPPWHEGARTGGRPPILLDPGVVFGTGTHPTTHDCLAALQLAFKQRPVTRVLDLGTGTGLLALAAARLGASRVLAVDLNALAATTALRNVRANDMADRILVVRGDAKNFMDLPCDLMVSNIHYEVMRFLVAAPGFQAKKQFILSGLLRSQAREIEHQLMQGPARILQKWDMDGIWYTFYGTHA
jgi:ribosomal protein L11 methyltransferase